MADNLGQMGLTKKQLTASLEAVSRKDKQVRGWLKEIGMPEPRSRPKGYEALLRTLIGQQVSVAAARAIAARLEVALGGLGDPAVVLGAEDDALRAAGLSRQKIVYARALAEAVTSGQLNFRRLARLEDEDAIAMLSSVKGFGRWSAEIYLMFAEGRTDIWPSGDLGVQEGLKRLLVLDERPRDKATREIGARWSPHRSAMALFCWHVYAVTARAEKTVL